MKSLTELDQGKTIVYRYTRDGKAWTYYGEAKALDVTPEAGDEVDLVAGGRYVYTEDGEWLEAKDPPVIDGKENDKKLETQGEELKSEIGRLRARMEHADIVFKRCKPENIPNIVAMIEMVGFEKAMGASIAADKENKNAKD